MTPQATRDLAPVLPDWHPYAPRLAFAFAILMLAGVIGHGIYHEYRALDAEERRALANQAKVVDDNLSQRLATANSALASIRAELPWLLAQRRLQALAGAMIGVRTFVFINAAGKVIFSTLETPAVAGVDLSANADSLFNRHLKSRRLVSFFSGTTATTGGERLLAFRTIRPDGLAMDKPLVYSVSRATPEIFAAWRQQALTKVSLFCLLVLVGSQSLFIYQKRRRANRSTCGS